MLLIILVFNVASPLPFILVACKCFGSCGFILNQQILFYTTDLSDRLLGTFIRNLLEEKIHHLMAPKSKVPRGAAPCLLVKSPKLHFPKREGGMLFFELCFDVFLFSEELVTVAL